MSNYVVRNRLLSKAIESTLKVSQQTLTIGKKWVELICNHNATTLHRPQY